jgi:hypothetical protein
VRYCEVEGAPAALEREIWVVPRGKMGLHWRSERMGAEGAARVRAGRAERRKVVSCMLIVGCWV